MVKTPDLSLDLAFLLTAYISFIKSFTCSFGIDKPWIKRYKPCIISYLNPSTWNEVLNVYTSSIIACHSDLIKIKFFYCDFDSIIYSFIFHFAPYFRISFRIRQTQLGHLMVFIILVHFI